MFCEEQRPLKRPKLGVPDVYPQENRQKEVSYVYFISLRGQFISTNLSVELMAIRVVCCILMLSRTN